MLSIVHNQQRPVLSAAASVLWLIMFCASPLDAEISSETDVLVARVRSILESKCFGCHGANKTVRGELHLNTRESLLKGGAHGSVISFTLPEDSALVRAIRYEDLKMPPDQPLSPEDTALLTEWVKRGVPWTGGSLEISQNPTRKTAIPNKHWAYQPLSSPEVPDVQSRDWIKNPLDRFILARLEQNKLSPNPRAGKVTWLRRAFFNLTGLPPTPEEVDAFVMDETADAFGKITDRLLSTPQYGEKWARHWLDLVRYAETDGYERDGTKANAWRFRDYVIDAYNQDMPFDQFVIEQLAGDEINVVNRNTRIATGYYRLGIWDDEPVDPEQAFYDSLDDVVSTTSKVFLAMTLGCSRCHDHKIDPLSQIDYYQVMAFFHNTFQDIRQLEFEKTAFTLNTQTVIASDQEQVRYRTAQERWEKNRMLVETELQKLESLFLEDLPEKDKEASLDENKRAELLEKVLSTRPETQRKRYDNLKSDIEHLDQNKVAPLPEALTIKENGSRAPKTYVLLRGNAHARGDRVEPAFPEVLGFDKPILKTVNEEAPSSGRRRVFAEWVAGDENPLTARVIVNRIWQHHFGRGLVRTPNDFGFNGARPTHPQLLDWLARWFMEEGWSIKSLHRMIVLSATYQMSSKDHSLGLARDPNNNLFWRYDMRRLDAEAIRDGVMSVSGMLNRQQFGPSVYPDIPPAVRAGASRPEDAWGVSPIEQQHRRSIYVFVKRSLMEPLMSAFDLADTDSSCPERFTTVVPTQALTTLNGQFFNQQASFFVQRLRDECGENTVSQITRGLRLAFGRIPDDAEISRCVEWIRRWNEEEGISHDQALFYFCLIVLNLNEFIFVD